MPSGVTIAAPPATTAPLPPSYPLVYTRARWADDWELQVDLEFRGGEDGTGSETPGRVMLRRRYGSVRQVYATAYEKTDDLDLRGTWVKVTLADESNNETTIFVGRIVEQSKMPHAGDVTETPAIETKTASGDQTFVAYAPRHLLEKIALTTSWWHVVENEENGGAQVEDVPDVNAGDKETGWIVGNRSDVRFPVEDSGFSDGVFLFGSAATWTRLQFLEYLLALYATRRDGPLWTIAGQTDILDAMTDTIRVRPGATLADIVNDLVPTKLGVDWFIVPTDDGFELRIYSMNAEQIAFGEHVLPSNPNVARIEVAADQSILSCEVAQSNKRRFNRVAVYGEPIKITLTLYGETAFGEVGNEEYSLAPMWTEAQEAAYLQANGIAGSIEENENVRASDEMRNVFQFYGVPEFFDFYNGTAMPKVTDAGEVANINDADADDATKFAPWHSHLRRTLRYTTLRAGIDYSTNPETDNRPDGAEPNYLPPFVILWNQEKEINELADVAGISVQAAETEWGVVLNANPNHLLAHGHYDSASRGRGTPVYDYRDIIATVTIEGSQRLKLVYETPGIGEDNGPEDDGSEFAIYVPNAELWWIAPGTVVGLYAGQLQFLGDTAVAGEEQYDGNRGRTIRNDADRLVPVMAGALARFNIERARAVVTRVGLHPWQSLIGHILEAVETNGTIETVNSPLTSVEWRVDGEASDRVQTVLKTGNAK